MQERERNWRRLAQTDAGERDAGEAVMWESWAIKWAFSASPLSPYSMATDLLFFSLFF